MFAEQIANRLSEMVRIPSVNPAQAGPRAGVAGEAALAAWASELFTRLGAQVVRHEVHPDRPNIYGLWRTDSPRWRALDVHMDTVGVENMTGDPFSGEVRGGRVWGRGAVDTKAVLAIATVLLERCRARGQMPATNLLLAATVDEESGATGAPALARWLEEQDIIADEMMVAEPTRCAPVHGHRGVLRMAFDVQGVASHSSKPHLGRNAITAAARVVQAMAEEHQRLAASANAGALGSGSLTVTGIQGGRGSSVVPDFCRVNIDRRLGDGEICSAQNQRLAQLARQQCPLPLQVRTLLEMEPFYQPADAPWVQALTAWSGQRASVAPYGTNAWAYPRCARATVVMGPGSIDQAHGAEEWVELSELEKMARIVARWWEVEA